MQRASRSESEGLFSLGKITHQRKWRGVGALRCRKMMLNDNKPVVFNAPFDQNVAVLYFLHDWHYGSAQFDERKWKVAKKEILSSPNHYAVIVGDMMENAVVGSKSDIYSQTANPQKQMEWLTEQIIDFGDHIIGGTDGNHERNRSTATCGLYPLYDAFLVAGKPQLYRPHYCVLDVGVGRMRKERDKQQRYHILAKHTGKSTKNISTADYWEGIDLFAYGHDHTSKDQAYAHMVYDSRNRKVYKRHVETINCGSGLMYGGYSPDMDCRPNSDKAYKAFFYCDGEKKRIETLGFYW